MNPDIEPRVRSTVRSVVGPEFSTAEIDTLEDRALDAADIRDLPTLSGIRGDVPVMLTPRQKTIIDRVISAMGNDKLGNRAKAAYQKAQKDGQVRVR